MFTPDRQDTEQKACSVCKKEKPFAEFYKRAPSQISKNGKPSASYQSRCKGCLYLETRARHRVSYEAVAEIKTVRGCTDCGYNAHPAALQFDHLPEFEKSFDIAQGITSRSLKKILAEIEKCEVVCGNCHAIRTYQRHRDGKVI